MSQRYTTVIFDLDGTLMNTLADLAASANHALRLSGFPVRSVEEVRSFVGNGVRKLIERAVPQGVSAEQLERVFADFRNHYAAHCRDTSAPYAGVVEAVEELHRMGIRMAIVSNKPDAEVKKLNQEFFSRHISVALGENEAAGIGKKPAPDMVRLALEELGVSAGGALYVGDSDVDIATARNSGLPCLSVSWGFRSEVFLLQHGATHIIHSPSQLPGFVKGE